MTGTSRRNWKSTNLGFHGSLWQPADCSSLPSGNLSNLTVLWLANNQIRRIPLHWGPSPICKDLALYRNQLTGSIRRNWDLPFDYLIALFNQLTGSIRRTGDPAELDNLIANPQLNWQHPRNWDNLANLSGLIFLPTS